MQLLSIIRHAIQQLYDIIQSFQRKYDLYGGVFIKLKKVLEEFERKFFAYSKSNM